MCLRVKNPLVRGWRDFFGTGFFSGSDERKWFSPRPLKKPLFGADELIPHILPYWFTQNRNNFFDGHAFLDPIEVGSRNRAEFNIHSHIESGGAEQQKTNDCKQPPTRAQ